MWKKHPNFETIIHLKPNLLTHEKIITYPMFFDFNHYGLFTKKE